MECIPERTVADRYYVLLCFQLYTYWFFFPTR